jgi:hypothetical protein
VTDSRADLTERIHRSPVGPAIRSAVSVACEPWWRLQGSKPPAPPHRKRQILTDIARSVRPAVFVETGTFRGDTVARLAPLVPHVISIELDDTFYADACRRFAGVANVELLHGDSAEVLPEVVDRIEGAALFWLDGHYSSGTTALGDEPTPIVAELRSVLAATPPHVVLIDDARLFDGTDGYPRLDEVRTLADELRPGSSWAVSDDIVRISPSRA